MISILVRRTLYGIVIRAGVRQLASRSVDSATNRLEANLPDSVVRAANVLPGDLLRLGGSAVLAAEAARSAAIVTKRASSGVMRAGAHAGSAVSLIRTSPERLYALRDNVVADIAAETESARRSLMSDFQRELRGEEAAVDALLDLRSRTEGLLPEVPEPIPSGRRRFIPQLGPAPINRVQRTYQKPLKAWDRPLRRR